MKGQKTNRQKVLQRLLELALDGNVTAAKLYLYHTVSEDDANLSVGQILALVRDEMGTIKKEKRHKENSGTLKKIPP